MIKLVEKEQGVANLNVMGSMVRDEKAIRVELKEWELTWKRKCLQRSQDAGESPDIQEQCVYLVRKCELELELARLSKDGKVEL